MTDQEIRHLLAIAMSYDNRKPGEANVLAWGEAAERGRWTFESAREAIHQHYAQSTEFLMPAHVTGQVKAMREEQALRAAAALPAKDDPEAAERHRAIVRTVLGEPSKEAERTASALSVACPWCGAPPGSPCTNGKHVRRTPHPSRVDASRSVA